jgi:hypothetical protein
MSGGLQTAKPVEDVRFYEDSFVKDLIGSTMPQGGMGVLLRERFGGLKSSTLGDPRPGCDGRSSQRSTELLSVPNVFIRHHMQHARDALGQTPITDAPHLNGRSRRGDPRTSRAR